MTDQYTCGRSWLAPTRTVRPAHGGGSEAVELGAVRSQQQGLPVAQDQQRASVARQARKLPRPEALRCAAEHVVQVHLAFNRVGDARSVVGERGIDRTRVEAG